MNILRAEHFLKHYGNSSTRLADLYDDDEMLRSALATLFPDFEYPDFSHLTLGQIFRKYHANPLPLTPQP